MATGMDSQFGIKTESVYGTGVVVDTFVPILGESMAREEEFTVSEGIIAGNRLVDSTQWNSGNLTFSGSIEAELYTRNMRVLLEHMLGSVSGTGPWTFIPGTLQGKSFTMQVGKPSLSAVHPFTYAGCKITSWEIALAAGEIATFGFDVTAQSETTATGLATASYPALLRPYKFTHGTVQYNNADLDVKQITISGDSMLNTDRRYIGTQQIAEPIEEDRREFTGSLTVDFASLSIYNDFIAHTEREIELQLDAGGGNTMTITMNCRIDGTTPALSGRGLVEQDIPFTVIKPTAGTGITVVVAEA
jgi:Phage tail tube protein